MSKPEQIRYFIDTCNTHAARLSMALSHVVSFYPFTASAFSTLKDDQLSFIEFMISRVTKLQDTIGAKIFPALIDLLESNTERQSFLDILHKLEKWNFLPTTEGWIHLREVRNYLTLDYPDQPELMAKHINRAVESSKELLLYWSFLKEKIEKIRELS